MQCKACQSESADGNKFCGTCGAAVASEPVAAVPAPGEDGAFFCARHSKTVTRLRCGRCETPICTRCTVYSPAGTRCKACARNKVAVRPAAVLHEAGRLVTNTSQGVGRRVWYLALWYFILSFFRGPWE